MVRNRRIDILRGLGFCCIILAHSNAPELVSQIRNFGVPLLVLISGIASVRIGNRYDSYGAFLTHRLMRLVFPSWVFLLFFFLSSLLFFYLSDVSYPFTGKQIASGFFLGDGIGYLWIIRVFVLLAFITPLVLRLNTLISNSLFFYLLLVAIFSVYEVMVHLSSASTGSHLSFLLKENLCYVIPYGCLFSIGVRIASQAQAHVFRLCLVSGVIFAIAASILYLRNGHFVPTQAFKYPPQVYYLSYGSFAALATYLAVGASFTARLFPWNVLSYLGRSSMWAYLWHIYLVYLLDWTPAGVLLSWHVKSVLLFVGSLTCIYCQKRFLSKMLESGIGNRTKVALTAVFNR